MGVKRVSELQWSSALVVLVLLMVEFNFSVRYFGPLQMNPHIDFGGLGIGVSHSALRINTHIRKQSGRKRTDLVEVRLLAHF